MSNRTLAIFTGLVFLGMLILFGLNITSIVTGQPESQPYLQFNNVRGMAIGHNQLLYTLNFKQQNQVIELLNKAVIVEEIKSGSRENPDFDQLVVYQFEKEPEVIIKPVTYVDHNLIFSAPQWDASHYFMDLSDGDLQQLLSQTYDP